MLLTIVAIVLQTPELEWRDFKALGWTAHLSAEDLATADHTREAAKRHLDESDNPLPWYVSIRTRIVDPDGKPEVKRVGYVCSRGHVDDAEGIVPITPHSMEGEIYDLVCFGEGVTSPGSESGR